MDKIKGLKEKVDALIRSLQGSQQRQGNAIMDRGLEQVCVTKAQSTRRLSGSCSLSCVCVWASVWN